MIKIINWSSYQSYKDRKPPWIRLHRSLIDNYEFQSMSVNSRALLPMLWLLACENDDPKSGIIDSTVLKIAFRLRIREQTVTDSLREMLAAGFVELDQPCSETVTKPYVNPTYSVTPETETETETETDISIVGQTQPDHLLKNQINEIISYLNMKANKKFSQKSKATIRHIKARLCEGYSLENFKTAIDNQVRQWIGTKNDFYLRPGTLFNSEKFDGYVNNNNSVHRNYEELTNGEKTILALRGKTNGMDTKRNNVGFHEVIELKAKKPTRGKGNPYNFGGMEEVSDT